MAAPQVGKSPEDIQRISRERLAQLRSAGMHAIRFEFVVRLLRVQVKMDTMSIFWDHGARELQDAGPGEVRWRLVLGRGRRASAEFQDHWVLRYPGDPAIKQAVEAEIDQLVEKVRARYAASAESGVSRPQAAPTVGRDPGRRI